MREIFPVLQDLARVYLMVIQEAWRPAIRTTASCAGALTAPLSSWSSPYTPMRCQGHFSVPAAVMHELAIPDDGQVYLEVRAEGILLYKGALRLKSKNEVYPIVDDPTMRGLDKIQPKQLIHVLIEKAASRP